VLQPLADVAPGEVHPSDGRNYAALWEGFDGGKQMISRVEFSWRGRSIS